MKNYIGASLGLSFVIAVVASVSVAYGQGKEEGELVQVKTVRNGVTYRLYEKQSIIVSGGKRETYYRISRDGGRTYGPLRKQDKKISLKGLAFDPLSDDRRRRAEVMGMDVPKSAGDLRLVQLETRLLPEYEKQVREADAEVVSYIPGQTYVVRADETAVDTIERLPFVRWVGPYDPVYKLAPVLSNRLQKNGPAGATRYVVNMFSREPDEVQSVVDAAHRLGGKIVARSDVKSSFMEVMLTETQLMGLIEHPNINFVEPWTAPEADMDIVREVSGADFLEQQVPFYTGVGVNAEVMDSGLRMTHNSLGEPQLHGGNSTNDSHGTSAYGIVFGDGTADTDARGLLPDGNGIFASYEEITDRAQHAAELVNPGGGFRAVFQTNSWGSGRTTEYTNISAEMDEIIFDNDILITQSQSNADNRNSRPQAWAKNIVSIGGIRHYDTATLGDDEWDGASIGPAADGRIKPDLSHFYDNVWTTANTNDMAHRQFGGTSAATPITAGHFGLMFQMWADGIFTGEGAPGLGGNVFAERPHAATAKAVMINTAQQYPFNGEAHNLTRVHQGWGFADVEQLYQSAEANGWQLPLVVDEEYVLTDGQSREFNINVSGSSGNLPWLKATLVYMDPPGNPAAAVATINDLNLRLTSPSGQTYWGNVGLLDGNWSTPGGTPSEVDTVENIFVENAELGDWTVEVIADRVVEDAHVETTAVDADFALVLTCEGVDRCTQTEPSNLAWLIPVINLILL